MVDATPRPQADTDADAVPALHAGADAVSAGRAAFWSRTVRWWDVAFYAMVAIAALTLALEADDDATRAATVGLVALLAVVYTAVGRRAARCGEPRLAMAYLVVLIAVVAAVSHLEPTGTVLLFVAYSQIWYLSVTRRVGLVLTVVLTVVLAVALATRPGATDGGGLTEMVASLGLGLVFSILLGLWITHVAEQGEERAWLLERLEAAQDELARSHHAAGVLAERERMAREIHDTLAQGFTSVVMLSQAAAGDVRAERTESALDRLALVERTARENLAEARALVAALAPVDLDGATLAEALARLAARFGAETGITVDVDVRRAPAGTSREREVVLLRAAQEALTNVRRHAAARRVRLCLDEDDGTTRLVVVDDGRGMAADVAEGFGLRGMRDRVTAEGGDVAVEPGPDGGTLVRVALPSGGSGS